MSRIKEPPIGTTQVPNYKSPSSRILRSLRQAYDNARGRLADKSNTVMSLKGKLRDTQESRDDWKARANAAEAKLAKYEQENINQQGNLKKRGQ